MLLFHNMLISFICFYIVSAEFLFFVVFVAFLDFWYHLCFYLSEIFLIHELWIFEIAWKLEFLTVHHLPASTEKTTAETDPQWTKSAPKCNSCRLTGLQSTSKLSFSLTPDDLVHHPNDPGIFRLMYRWVSICTLEDVPAFLRSNREENRDLANRTITVWTWQTSGVLISGFQTLVGTLWASLW